MSKPPKTSLDRRRGVVIGERIKAWRTATLVDGRPLPQTKLAARASVDPTTIPYLEQGKSADPGFCLVARIAKALGQSLDALADEVLETS
jgi:transcriptional regulator with XRE-family HTH domain